MRLFKALIVALSTYTVIPMPQLRWEEDSMKHALCFFPAAGVLCTAALWLWLRLAQALQLQALFFASAAVCLPLLLTGGIHMDGFMDTVDALASHQPRERKLAIMKDPACGAFAVIYCGVYLLLSLGLMAELYDTGGIEVYCLCYVLSRALSALCAANLPNARGVGMLWAYTAQAERRAVNGVCGGVTLLCALWLLCAEAGAGCGMLLSAALWLLFYVRLTKKQFGGVTGDTAGFFLQGCELLCLTGVWIGGLLW